MIMVNLACGNRYHKAWINLDFNAPNGDIKKVNLLDKLPFEDNFVDIIYCSHFLEHLSSNQANTFIKECYRILKKNGIIRVVVPDLENIVKEYLKNLQHCLDNEIKKLDINQLLKYKHSQLELLDQMVREKSGGDLLDFYKSNITNSEIKAYIKERTGERLEAYNIPPQKKWGKIRALSLNKLKYWMLMRYINLISYIIPSGIRSFVVNKNVLIGEKHRWMYDRFSLSLLMKENEFTDVRFLEFNNSGIPEFNKYLLDINEDGTPYKGFSSLYCEAKK